MQPMLVQQKFHSAKSVSKDFEHQYLRMQKKDNLTRDIEISQNME